jgi:hypothetical protein
MGVYDDADGVRMDTGGEDDEEEIGQVRACVCARARRTRATRHGSLRTHETRADRRMIYRAQRGQRMGSRVRREDARTWDTSRDSRAHGMEVDVHVC